MKENIQEIKAALQKCPAILTLPVYARALESLKVNPVLKDEKAVEIMKMISTVTDPDAVRNNDLSHYAFVFRSLCFDRLIRDYIWRHPEGTIINIGCGLDTTHERLKAGSVQWYDLDLPEVIDLRKLLINESCNRKFISSSFLKNEWIKEINFNDSVLIFASGVYYYYCENTIRRFFAKMSFAFPASEMLFDVTSPAGVRAANRVIRKAGINAGPFLKWGIKNSRSILKWNPRMVFLGNYNVFNLEGYRLPFRLQIPGMISDALSIEQIIHLRIRYNYHMI